jgi:hypothetical protein
MLGLKNGAICVPDNPTTCEGNSQMQVVFQKDIVYEGGIRTHPWIDSVHNTDWKCYDFKQHPELVFEVLEDFKDWEQY